MDSCIEETIEKLELLNPRVLAEEKEYIVLELLLTDLFRRFQYPTSFLILLENALAKLESVPQQALKSTLLDFLPLDAQRGAMVPISVCKKGKVWNRLKAIVDKFASDRYPAINLFSVHQSNKPTEELKRLILTQASISVLTPYRIDRTPGPKMFYGRTDYLRDIENAKGNLYVVGPRRIGKSTLLRAFQRHSGMVALPRAVGSKLMINRCSYVDVSALGEHTSKLIWRYILKGFGLDFGDYRMWARELPDWEHPKVKKFESNEAKALAYLVSFVKGKLTIVLDEVDGWLQQDTANSWRAIDQLRAITDDGYAKVILVGYEALSIAVSQPRFPLGGRGGRISVDPLKKPETERLIVEPMKELNVRMNELAHIVNRIWGISSGLPHLVQDICGHMLRLAPVTPSSMPIRVVGPNELITAIDRSVELNRYLNSVTEPVFPLALAVASLFSYSSAQLPESYEAEEDDDPPPFLVKEITSRLSEKGYEVEIEDLKLALMHLELRFMLQPTNNSRTRWVWRNQRARRRLASTIVGYGEEWWFESLRRKHETDNWRELYNSMGHFYLEEQQP